MRDLYYFFTASLCEVYATWDTLEWITGSAGLSHRTEMNAQINRPFGEVNYRETAAPAAGEERFAERRRIALLEPDSALRSTLVRLLLRLGVIVSFKHHPQNLVESVSEGNLDGAIVALEYNSPWIVAIQNANAQRQIPIVVLTNAPPGPRAVEVVVGVRFLDKPFDARELCELLGLPSKARIVAAG
jgi:CheY-like chemotaxis protein